MFAVRPTLHLDSSSSSHASQGVVERRPTVAAPPTVAPSVAAAGVVEIDSGRLLQGQRELYIRHGDECYRLRHTRNDKLILTK